MSDDRFPYLKNFLKPTTGEGAKSDRTPSADFSALLAPEGLMHPGNIISSGEEDTGGLLEEFHHGEVSPKLPQEQDSQAQNPRERVLTCADCPHFEANQGPNPLQGWGRCLKRNKGRYGCATACGAALAPGPKDASRCSP
jgi:hypothetical protein